MLAVSLFLNWNKNSDDDVGGDDSGDYDNSVMVVVK
jgi:hypothetical protein